VAAFVGMGNDMGKERGAALILEQAVLPSMTTPRRGSRARPHSLTGVEPRSV
jgi:hypothetical protein